MSVSNDEIRIRLIELFHPLEIDPDALYVNEVADLISEQVIQSRTLLEEAVHHLERGQVPNYDIGLVKMFHEPDTFDPAHRARPFSLYDFEKVIEKLLRSLA